MAATLNLNYHIYLTHIKFTILTSFPSSFSSIQCSIYSSPIFTIRLLVELVYGYRSLRYTHLKIYFYQLDSKFTLQVFVILQWIGITMWLFGVGNLGHMVLWIYSIFSMLLLFWHFVHIFVFQCYDNLATAMDVNFWNNSE